MKDVTIVQSNRSVGPIHSHSDFARECKTTKIQRMAWASTDELLLVGRR
jgi:hypothetical protein